MANKEHRDQRVTKCFVRRPLDTKFSDQPGLCVTLPVHISE